jgi:hypothetical protein
LRDIEPAFPALTCTAQASYLTGLPAGQHGAVANGWFDRTYAEYRNWHQSSRLMMAPRVFGKIKESDPKATVFMNCWWFCMYDSDVDFAVTPRPQYLADGGKLPDCYTKPVGLRDELQKKLGKFPLHKFWGPTTSVASSRWIADSSIMVDQVRRLKTNEADVSMLTKNDNAEIRSHALSHLFAAHGLWASKIRPGPPD